MLAHRPNAKIPQCHAIPAEDQPAGLEDPLAQKLRTLIQKDYVHSSLRREVGQGHGQARLELAA